MFTAKQLPSLYECVKDRGICPALYKKNHPMFQLILTGRKLP